MVTRYHLKNLDCADCALKIESHLRGVEGVKSADINFAALILTVETDQPALVRREVEAVEPDIELIPLSRSTEHNLAEDNLNFKAPRALVIIAVSGLLFLGVLVVEWFAPVFPQRQLVLYGLALGAYLLAGWNVLKGALRTVRRGTFFDENVLMTIATVGAIAINALSEAAGVMLFYKIGEFFQSAAIHRSRRSIRSLLAVRPHVAHVLRGEVQEDVSPEEVRTGDTVSVRPGEKIPLDGIVLSGSTQVDTSALTGESRPYLAVQGDSVLAGEINMSGLITLEVTRPFFQSSIVKLLEQVEHASGRKARTEKFMSRIARYYTPFVVAAAALVALVPPLAIPGQTFSVWVYRALVLLVISCPCALVISIPLGFFGGIGGASKRGVLVKGAQYLERLAAVRTVVFDKTGTLTKGVFRVTRVVPGEGFSVPVLMGYAAAAEFYSNHPIALSIIRESDVYGVHVSPGGIGEHEEVAGMGVSITYNGKRVLAGNRKLMDRERVVLAGELTSAGSVYVAVDGMYAGSVVVGDELKEGAAEAVRSLRDAGVHTIAMLTGDSEATAREVAAQLGIDVVGASLLPGQKVEWLEKIMEKGRNGGVAFVGDGVNDAPVIARADVGIAMGTLGSDAAIETADVVISGDSPLKVAEAIHAGRATMAIVWQNIILAVGVKLLFIVLGALGMASMWEAVFADMGMAVVAVLNAGRALK